MKLFLISLVLIWHCYTPALKCRDGEMCEHGPGCKQNRQTYLLRRELVFLLCRRVPSPLCPLCFVFCNDTYKHLLLNIGYGNSHLSVEEFNIQLPPMLGLSMHAVKGYFTFISTWRKDNYCSTLHITMSPVSRLCDDLKKSCATPGIKGKGTPLSWKSWTSEHWWMRVYSLPEILMCLWSFLVLCGWPVPESG